ncbi:MAG TPA: hypothetical protein VIJ75_16810 [Hanamia sp.]
MMIIIMSLSLPSTRFELTMKLKILFLLFFILWGGMMRGESLKQDFDKPGFYEVLASGKLSDIDKELDLLNTVSIPEKEAYEGTLLMRKSGLLKIPAEKLRFFKKGRIKLEGTLLKDSGNCEYHFLRLTIQEHAPKVVKYSAELENDKQYILKYFKDLSPIVQQVIINYSKNSKILNPADF